MKLYRRYEALSPIYQGGLTNHLPMMMIALLKLGLKEDIIIDKCDQYKQEKGVLDLTEVSTPVTEFEQAYVHLTSTYLGEINHKGIDIIIGEFIQKHQHMVVSGLFHGLIRLAYAKEVGDPLLIAQALAYFDCISGEVKVNTKKVDRSIAFAWFDDLRTTFLEDIDSLEKHSTYERLQEIIHHPLIDGNIGKVQNIRRNDLLSFVLTYYLDTKSFYVLHLITGLEALFELEEYFTHFQDVLDDFFVFAQLFILFDKRQEVVVSDKTVEDVIKQVELMNNAHDIKLLYSLSKLKRLFDEPLIDKVASTLYSNESN
jgi:hypothetical protein